MIWSRAAVLEMKEDDLTRQVLVPLFSAMGYHDVRFHGGGNLEQGKDLTMWREDPVRPRVNIAAVVKAVAITGKSSTISVVEQIEQAFSVSFLDVSTGAQQSVHECLVITPREVKKEGAHTLHNVLQAKPFGRYVTIVDGDQLWQYVQKYLGPRVTLGTIIANYQALNRLPGYDLKLTLAKGQTTVTVRSTSGEPVLVRRPTFAETPKGKQAQDLFEHFLRTGEPTTIDREGVESGFDDDSPLGPFRGDSPEGVITLRSAIPAMHGDLCFQSPSGERAEALGVVMSGYAGTEYLTLTNAEQNIPLAFKVRFRVTSEVDEAQMESNVKVTGSNVVWYARALSIFRTARRGARLIFREFDTGIEHSLGTVATNESDLPSEAHFDLVMRTLRVQEQTKQPIVMPSRPFFADEDIEDLCFVESALSTGVVEAESASITLSRLPTDTEADWRRRFTSDGSDFRWETPWVQRRLLDSYVALGPMRICDQSVRFQVPDIEAAIATLLANEPLDLTIVPTGDAILRVTFPRWASPSEGGASII